MLVFVVVDAVFWQAACLGKSCYQWPEARQASIGGQRGGIRSVRRVRPHRNQEIAVFSLRQLALYSSRGCRSGRQFSICLWNIYLYVFVFLCTRVRIALTYTQTDTRKQA